MIRALASVTCLSTVLVWNAQAQTLPDPMEDELPPPAQDWPQEKCGLYDLIFHDALGLQGHEGLSNEFLSANQRFIDAACQGERTLCPVSEAEYEFSDLLTMMTMNEGMASTFVPFGCPNETAEQGAPQ